MSAKRGGRLEEGAGGVRVAAPHLENTEVVEGLGVLRLGDQHQPEALVGHVHVPEALCRSEKILLICG